MGSDIFFSNHRHRVMYSTQGSLPPGAARITAPQSIDLTELFGSWFKYPDFPEAPYQYNYMAMSVWPSGTRCLAFRTLALLKFTSCVQLHSPESSSHCTNLLRSQISVLWSC